MGHSERHWLYHSFCWKQLLGQQHAPCATPPSTHAPPLPMHVVFSGGGGAGGGASGGSVSVACTCTSVACAARVTKSRNAADHGGIGALRLRKGAVVTSYHRQACQAALTLNRRGMVRANPGPAAAVEAPPGASAAILDALPPPPPNGASDLPYRDTRADPRRQIASTGGREARTRAAARSDKFAN